MERGRLACNFKWESSKTEGQCKGESTKEHARVGTVRSSEEASVMEVERRDSPVQVSEMGQPIVGGTHVCSQIVYDTQEAGV